MTEDKIKNDWLKIYDTYSTQQGSVVRTREIVIGLMMLEGMEKPEAQDLLMKILNERVLNAQRAKEPVRRAKI